MNGDQTSMWPPGLLTWGFLTNGFLQANDTMQGRGALLHVISLVGRSM